MRYSPQLIWGDSCGHDFDFHLVSWFDALNSWRHGILYPHWTPSANFGAGEPRFVFYSPLTWMLGAALAAVLPWSLVPVVLTFLLLAGTGLATRALAREALDEGAATLAGCIAICSPAIRCLRRTSAQHLPSLPADLDSAGAAVRFHRSDMDPYWGATSQGLKPLNSAASSATEVVPSYKASTALLVAIAGAWLSNPTVGVMACYLLAGLAITQLRCLRARGGRGSRAAGAALGMGLSLSICCPQPGSSAGWTSTRSLKTRADPRKQLALRRHADPALAFHDQVLHTRLSIAVADDRCNVRRPAHVQIPRPFAG